MRESVEYDVFIAHAGPDADAAGRLYESLVTRGGRVFLSPESLLPGDPWDAVIPRAQRNSAITAVIVTETTSEAFYAQEEVAAAIDLVRSGSVEHRVVPVLVGAAPKENLPYGLRRLHHIRVTGSTPEAWDSAAQTLLGTLGLTALESLDPDPVAAYKRAILSLRPARLYAIFCDIDGATRIDHRFGTEAADEVMREVLELLDPDATGSAYVEIKYFAQIGSDEFVWLISAPNSRLATKFAEERRLALATHDWTKIAPSLYVTASFGVARSELTELPPREAIRAILGAQSAKRAGGNRTERAPTTLPAWVSKRIRDHLS